ncbi:histidine phosphatase family protein [Acinetobacter faecalis]|uniref:histidine phosphatase family protein n=1 Tax=Acinetobacter faecalis TaxID=2665161 RepID=UPI002A91480E|nr:histidine phosphatase family protein [Acinetobacter faecalis]MDY6468742.1 histidine phosphatase family protein [Acinetobacter faecalis]
MTTIYLIRHGQASFGTENYDKLSPNGEMQAKVLGQYLDKILKEEPYVVSGSMQRHLQTARISLDEYFPAADIEINNAWNEFNHQQVFEKYDANFSNPEVLKKSFATSGDSHKFLSEVFGHAVKRWTGNEHHDYDESWIEFQNRVGGAFQQLCNELMEQKPRYAVVYTSGGVISTLIGNLLGLSVEKTFALTWAIANTSITTLRLVGNEPQLLSLNEHQYLKTVDAQLLTWV